MPEDARIAVGESTPWTVVQPITEDGLIIVNESLVTSCRLPVVSTIPLARVGFNLRMAPI